MDSSEIARSTRLALDVRLGSSLSFLALLAVLALAACSGAPALPVTGTVAAPTSAPILSPTAAPAQALAAKVAPATLAPTLPPTVNAAPTQAAAPAATQPPAIEVTTAPPTPAPQVAQKAPAPIDLKEELFLAGAPAFALETHCKMPENLQAGERAATWVSGLDLGLLCLFGFGDGETVQYEVTDASGTVAESSEGQPDNMDGDPLPSVKVFVGIGDKAPGTWHFTATAPSGELTGSFEAQPVTQDGQPAVILAIGPTLLPFPLGQSIPVAAYNLGAASTVQLGVYQVTGKTSEGRNMKLHEAAALDVNDGAAFVTLTLDPTYQPGEYCLILQVAPSYEPSSDLSAQGATHCFEVTK